MRSKFILLLLPILYSCGGGGGGGDTGDVPRGFAGTVYYQIAAGDLNGDSFTDIAAIAVIQDGVRDTPDPIELQIILQQSLQPGHFTIRQRLALASSSGSVKTADIDGDGQTDIVVTEPQSRSVRVLLQDSTTPGRFDLGGIYPAGNRVTSLEIAELPDVDLDGAPDLVMTTPIGITVLRQDGAARGTFPVQYQITVDDSLASSTALPEEDDGLAIGDLNSDGLVDIATVRWDIDSVRIYHQNASVPGTFDPAATLGFSLGTGEGLEPLVVGDVDGDGFDDVVAAGDRYFSTPRLYLRQQNPIAPGTFLPPRKFDLSNDGSPTQLLLSDVTGDGLTDVVIAKLSVLRSGFIEVQAQSGPPLMFSRLGVFRTLTLPDVDPFLRGFAVADLNNDDLPDIAVTDGQLAVLFNDPALTAHFQPARPLLE